MSLAWRWLPLVIPGVLMASGVAISSGDHGNAGPADVHPPQDRRIANALEILRHVPSGKELLARAREFWKLPHSQELERRLRWGEASKTDAVLTRHFNPRTGVESREREVTVYLREGQSLDDLVLDIAHELVHATTRPDWDPYDPKLTPGKYIFASIEGEGGEVQAVVKECQISFEIHERFGAAASSANRCKEYLAAESGELDTELIRRDFYRVGRWDKELGTRLGAERAMFPALSPETPRLYSSTGNAPYPVALLREFEEITQIACRNSRKRATAEAARAPASSRRNAAAFVARRCEREL